MDLLTPLAASINEMLQFASIPPLNWKFWKMSSKGFMKPLMPPPLALLNSPNICLNSSSGLTLLWYSHLTPP